MRIIYKKVKVILPCCGDCGEQLKGNGSIVTPYNCSCGVWEYDYKNYEFNLKSNAKVRSI